MADNVPITAGSGTNVATDDVSGVHYQKVKLDVGGDGISTPVDGSVPMSPTVGSYRRVTGTLNSLNDAVTIATDGAPEVVFIVIEEADPLDVTSTIAFESSYDDGSTWVAVDAYINNQGVTASSCEGDDLSYLSAFVAFGFLWGTTHVRLRVSVYGAGGGSATIVAEARDRAEGFGHHTNGVRLIGLNSNLDFPAHVSTLLDGITTSGSGGMVLHTFAKGGVFNGTTWDRLRGDTSGLFAQGNVANDVVDAGNPVKIGGLASAALPDAVADGDRVNAWLTTRGALNVRTVDGNGASIVSAAAALADGISNPTLSLIGAVNVGFNGTSLDRLRTLSAYDTAAASPNIGILAALPPDRRFTSVSLATAANSTQSWDTNGAQQATIRVGTSTTGTFTWEVSADGTNWIAASVVDEITEQWVTATNLTPASGKVYHIITVGQRLVRARTVTTLGATVALIATLSPFTNLIEAIETGPAPHNFGYAETGVSAQFTSAQTSTTIGPTVSSTQRMVVTSIQIQSYGTTAGTAVLYFGTGAFSRGTSKPVFDGEFAPSATSKPGYAQSKPNGWVGAADEELKLTTTNAQSITVTIWYYLANV